MAESLRPMQSLEATPRGPWQGRRGLGTQRRPAADVVRALCPPRIAMENLLPHHTGGLRGPSSTGSGRRVHARGAQGGQDLQEGTQRFGSRHQPAGGASGHVCMGCGRSAGSGEKAWLRPLHRSASRRTGTATRVCSLPDGEMISGFIVAKTHLSSVIFRLDVSGF